METLKNLLKEHRTLVNGATTFAGVGPALNKTVTRDMLTRMAVYNTPSSTSTPVPTQNNSIGKANLTAEENIDDAVDSRKQQIDYIFDKLKQLLLNVNSNEENEEQRDLDRPEQLDVEQDDYQVQDNNPSQLTDNEVDGEQEIERRYVKNAHLVFKRQNSDGLYEELWIYNVGPDSKNDEYQIRREILKGTDIEPHQMQSKDGTQSYKVINVGNAQMIYIDGLPN